MEKYLIRFADDRGVLRETVFETESLDALRKSLLEQGCYILSEKTIQRTIGEWIQAVLPLQARVSMSELTEFSQLLKTLLKAGLPLKDALEVLLDEIVDSPLSRALKAVRDDIVEGISFSKSLSRHPAVFPEIYIRTIVAGEKAGALEAVLGRLVSYFKGIIAVRRKMAGALIYPAILLMVALGAISYMVVKVVPEFSELFRSLDVPLPWFTQMVLDFSGFLGNWSGILVILGLIGIYASRNYYNTQAGRIFFDGIKLRIPVVRNLEERFAYSQFARTLGTLIEGGIPIMESLTVVIDSLENKEIVARLSRVIKDIEGGDSFARALKNVPGIPPTMVKVVHVGEESGRLGEMLFGIADHYDEEISGLTATLTALVEPVLFLFIAACIGTLIIALLLPILTAAGSIK